MSYFSRKVKRAYRFYKAKAGCWLHGRGLAYAEGALSATVTRANGETEELGVICRNEVTDTGVAYIVDAFQDSTELELMKYHACGTGLAPLTLPRRGLLLSMAFFRPLRPVSYWTEASFR
jgi:hypothetical protein